MKGFLSMKNSRIRIIFPLNIFNREDTERNKYKSISQSVSNRDLSKEQI